MAEIGAVNMGEIGAVRKRSRYETAPHDSSPCVAQVKILVLVRPTIWTPAVGGLIVCVCVSESVCPKTCRHIARCMMNG